MYAPRGLIRGVDKHTGYCTASAPPRVAQPVPPGSPRSRTPARKKGSGHEIYLGICEEHVGRRLAHRRAAVPRRVAAAQSHAVGRRPGAARGSVAPPRAPRGEYPLAALGVESLLPHRAGRARPAGARDTGAHRAVAVRTHPRLLSDSEFDPTPGWRESRERVAAGAGRD